MEYEEAFLPNDFYRVLLYLLVTRQERKTLLLSLSYKQTIKRIAMKRREGVNSQGMGKPHRQGNDIVQMKLL